MKSNFNELFNMQLADLKDAEVIDINSVLDDMMPFIRFEGRVTKSMMARQLIRNQLTSALNANEIYSCEKGNKGQFVWIGNANEEQLMYLREKAQRDLDAAERRKDKAIEFMTQISMAWDEDGNFIGYHVPKAVGE